MEKLNLCVIFGGMSTEKEVSVESCKNILKNLDKEKYDISTIFIDQNGAWINWDNKAVIEDVFNYLKTFDVVFPVLHGLYGEDGTIQGIFELLQIPYVGCGVLASSIGMDKVYTKIIFDRAEINQTQSCYLKKYKEHYKFIDKNFDEEVLNLKDACLKVEQKLSYPMFIKPSNCGSSIGVNKANNTYELEKAIEEAGKYDKKILVEQAIQGKEVECAVLGNEDVIAGSVGEIISADEFYSYDAKYNNANSKIIIPASISEEKIKEIKELAIKAFKAIDGKGLARVDFFVENGTEKIYLNEINTLPGFTSTSMYPMLIENYGIPYNVLLDKLIELALEKK